jgi:L-ascorbate metabolism protein UlaG (beta-lactamase superfamily)
MNIKWFGHACFRLKDRYGSAFTDPFPPQQLGYNRPKSKTNIITISHSHENHASLENFTGSPYIITRPGEYEVNGIFVTAIHTYHDNKKGAERGYNNVMLFQFDDLSICHLGDLGHILSQKEVEQLSSVDILLIPVGGSDGGTLNASQAAEVISLIEPYIVIPMHYKTPAYPGNLEPVEKFLKEMGSTSPSTMDELKLTRSNLPEETQVILLNY